MPLLCFSTHVIVTFYSSVTATIIFHSILGLGLPKQLRGTYEKSVIHSLSLHIDANMTGFADIFLITLH